MSKYTTQLRWIVEQIGQGLEVPEGQEYADAVYKYIGLSKYPIFDETYRIPLNDKIIDHFFFREIGFETAAQFAFYMQRTMNEIMPYYNQLYITQALIDDPMSDYSRKVKETWEKDISDSGTTSTTRSIGTDETAETETKDNNRNVYQDTPMSILSNSGGPSIEGLDYATNVTYDNGSGSTSATSSRLQNESDLRTDNLKRDDDGVRNWDESGRNHSQSYLLKEWRDTFLNIDMEIIGDLEDLFFGLW